MRIDIYAARVGVRYTYEELVASLPGERSIIATVTATDIAAARIGSGSTWFELVLHAPLAERPHETQLFAIADDHDVITYGIAYTPIGAAAIQTPVLHVARDRSSLVIAQYLGAIAGRAVLHPDERWQRVLATLAAFSPTIDDASPLGRVM